MNRPAGHRASDPGHIDAILERNATVRVMHADASFDLKLEHGGVAHSATGLLLAASQITTRYFLSSDWRSVVDLQVLPGPGRDAFTQRQADLEGQFGMADDPDAGQINQFAGYRFVTYTAETAVVQLARRTPEGKYTSAIHTLVWQNGDWKLQMQSDGSDASVRQEIGSLDGYQKWTGA